MFFAKMILFMVRTDKGYKFVVIGDEKLYLETTFV